MEFVPNADQLAGLDFMMTKSYGALFWDPGCRKTSTMLYAFKLLRDAGYVKRMLVVSETNVVDGPWVEEIEKWDDLDLSYAQLRGGERRRRNEFELDADVYLLNMENMEWFYKTYGKRKHGMDGMDMLCVDESSKFRNKKTHRFRALSKLLPRFKRRYIGTGTPRPKSYMNLWSQFYIVDMGESLGSMRQYRLNFFQPGGFKGKEWFLREGADVEINRAIKHRVSRVEKHLDVSISFEDIEIDLPSKARQAYKDLEEEFITEWHGKTITAANAAIVTGKLRQAANGGVYYDRTNKFIVLHKAKAEALMGLIQRLNGEPLLIAYEFKHDYELMKRCGLTAPSFSEASRNDRVTLKQQWNAGKLPVLCSQISSISHGQNVQFGGHHLAYYGLPFNLEDYEQFYQRLWRDGQTKNVRGYRFVTKDSVDEVALDVLNVRATDQSSFLAAFNRRYDL